jgi:hypothetical protein
MHSVCTRLVGAPGVGFRVGAQVHEELMDVGGGGVYTGDSIRPATYYFYALCNSFGGRGPGDSAESYRCDGAGIANKSKIKARVSA